MRLRAAVGTEAELLAAGAQYACGVLYMRTARGAVLCDVVPPINQFRVTVDVDYFTKKIIKSAATLNGDEITIADRDAHMVVRMLCQALVKSAATNG